MTASRFLFFRVFARAFFFLRFLLLLFIRTTIIEILLSRSAHASKLKHKQNINSFLRLVLTLVSFSIIIIIIINKSNSSSLYFFFFFVVVVFSSSSSSCLIYSRMQMMPSRDDYHHYHSLAFSLESTYWQEKRDDRNKIKERKSVFFLVDYLTITLSITINVSSAHQLKLDKKKKKKKETSIIIIKKETSRKEKKRKRTFQVFRCSVTLWHMCAFMYGFIEANK